MAVRELCWLEGFHSSCSMQRWVTECELLLSTLQYKYHRLSEQEQSLLQAIREVEAKEAAEKEKASEKRKKSIPGPHNGTSGPLIVWSLKLYGKIES